MNIYHLAIEGQRCQGRHDGEYWKSLGEGWEDRAASGQDGCPPKSSRAVPAQGQAPAKSYVVAELPHEAHRPGCCACARSCHFLHRMLLWWGQLHKIQLRGGRWWRWDWPHPYFVQSTPTSFLSFTEASSAACITLTSSSHCFPTLAIAKQSSSSLNISTWGSKILPGARLVLYLYMVWKLVVKLLFA